MEQQTNQSHGRLAFRAWLIALALFVAWFAATLVIAPDSAETPAPSAASAPDPGAVADGLPPWGSEATPVPPFDAGQEYALIGFGVKGLHEELPRPDVWTLDAGAPVLQAQLIKRGDPPSLVTDGVRVLWELDPGVTLTRAAGQAENPLRRGELAPGKDGAWFSAALPVSAVRSGSVNPYPVVRLVAVAEGGTVLARSAAALGVSPGFSCSHCHGPDPFTVLALHDSRMDTGLADQARSGSAVACRSCHSGTEEQDGKRTAGTGMSVSAAVHGWHAPYLSGQGQNACLGCHTGLGRTDADDGGAPRRLFERSVHERRGVTCVHCHGYLEDHAFSLLKAEREAGQDAAETALNRIKPRSATPEEVLPRLPREQEPDCAGCHWRPKPAEGRPFAFNRWTDNADALFSARRDDMDAVRCLTCHGAPHAQYPADNPVSRDRDNIPPMQYQQHARALGAAGNCQVCHLEAMDVSAHHPLVEKAATTVHIPDSVHTAMPVVRFSHTDHVIVDCATCHHKRYEDGGPIRCTDSGCHTNTWPASGDGVQDPLYYRTPFHGQGNSCFGCHTAAYQKGLPAGPVACKDCHSAPSPRWERAAAPAESVAPPPETPNDTPAAHEDEPAQNGAATPQTPRTGE